MSPLLEESESQQLYAKVLSMLDIKSDDKDLFRESSGKAYVTSLLHNSSSIVRSISPTLSSSGSHHIPVSVRPELQRPESSTTGLLCTQAGRKRQTQHESDGLALKIVPKDAVMPSYSQYVARAIEIILDECPKDKQMLCGQQILTAALSIQMEMKNKSKIL